MMDRSRTALLPGAVAALFIVLALAACGGGGDSGGVASLNGSSGADASSTTTTSSKDPKEAAVDFARCMREHGVDVPDPDANGGLRVTARPGDSAKVERAQKACQPILEKAKPELSPEQKTIMQDAALAFARCMREHGIDVPDPTFGSGGIVIQKRRAKGGGGFDPNDPKFEEAQKACQPIMNKAIRDAGLPKPGEGGPSTERRGEAGS
jgi:hypothetical protein